MVRFKVRWVLCEINLEAPGNVVSEGDVMKAVRDSVEENFGDYGVGKLSRCLKVEYFRRQLGLFVIRCAAAHVKLLFASLFFVATVGSSPAYLRVLHSGGSLLQTRVKLRSLLIDWNILCQKRLERLPPVQLQSAMKSLTDTTADEALAIEIFAKNAER